MSPLVTSGKVGRFHLLGEKTPVSVLSAMCQVHLWKVYGTLDDGHLGHVELTNFSKNSLLLHFWVVACFCFLVPCGWVAPKDSESQWGMSGYDEGNL